MSGMSTGFSDEVQTPAKMVSPARFERATCSLGGSRAIQLCHGDFYRGGIIQTLVDEIMAI